MVMGISLRGSRERLGNSVAIAGARFLASQMRTTYDAGERRKDYRTNPPEIKNSASEGLKPEDTYPLQGQDKQPERNPSSLRRQFRNSAALQTLLSF